MAEAGRGPIPRPEPSARARPVPDPPCASRADNAGASLPAYRASRSPAVPQLAFTDHGRGSPAVVFVHGFTCDRQDWDAQVRTLSATHRCIALDLPGHGDSAAPPEPGIAAAAAAVNETLDRLALDDVVLVGHSMGCRVVSETFDRARARVRGIAYIDGSLVEGEPEALVARYAAMIDAVGMDAFVDRVYGDFFVPSTPAAVRARVGARRAGIDLDAARRLLLDFLRWDATRCRAVLAGIDVPVLVIQSTAVGPDFERVPIGPGQVSAFAAAVTGAVHGAVLETVPCGHFTMLEAPEVTDRLLAGWLLGLLA